MIYILVSAVTTGEEKSNNTLREEQNLRDQKKKKQVENFNILTNKSWEEID